MYTGQTLCYSFVGKGNLGLERVARYSCAYLLYVVDIEIYSSCSILEDIRDPGTESTLDHIRIKKIRVVRWPGGWNLLRIRLSKAKLLDFVLPFAFAWQQFILNINKKQK